MAAKKTKAEKAEEVLQPDPVHAQAASEGFFARLLSQFTTAWRFFTRIPLPNWWNRPQIDEAAERVEIIEQTDIADREAESDLQIDKGATLIPLAETVRAWPVVGLFIGALAGLALWLAASAGLSPLAASFAAMIVAALATGALHEDGLADVADGFGGGADKAKKLRIMRDSHIGAYGVLALVLVVGFKAGSLSGFNSPVLAASAIIAAHTLSRAMLPMLMVVLPPASRSGLGKAAGQPNRENAAMAAAIGVLVAVLALGFGPGLVAAVLAALGVAGVGWLAHRHIDGFTGDVLGAAQQVSETLVLAGLAVMLRTVFYA
ncbi:MAG: adenosylcobinamide-GDP ribazoletransferase [Rhodospirillales bacterium]|nr:adenosylcobinamide-GDP ribazoletransferase [Rhodospirillales bacterium]